MVFFLFNQQWDVRTKHNSAHVRHTVPCGLLRCLHPHLHTLAGRRLNYFPSWNSLRGSQLMDRDESLPRKPRPAQAFVKNGDQVIDGSICWHLPGHSRKQQWVQLWQGCPRLYSSYRGYDQVMGTLKILQLCWSFDKQVLGFNEYFHTWETLKIRTLFKL